MNGPKVFVLYRYSKEDEYIEGEMFVTLHLDKAKEKVRELADSFGSRTADKLVRNVEEIVEGYPDKCGTDLYPVRWFFEMHELR